MRNTTNTVVTIDRTAAITIDSKIMTIKRPGYHEKIAFEMPEELKIGILNVCNHFAVGTSMMIGKKIEANFDGTIFGYVYRKDTDCFGQTMIVRDRIERLTVNGCYTKNGFLVNIEIENKVAGKPGQYNIFTTQLNVNLFKQHRAVCAIARELM